MTPTVVCCGNLVKQYICGRRNLGPRSPCFAHCTLPLPTVNSVCWAPHDYGLILACGSSDGAISLLTYTGEGQWEVKKINNAHTVSPAPAFPAVRVLALPCVCRLPRRWQGRVPAVQWAGEGSADQT